MVPREHSVVVGILKMREEWIYLAEEAERFNIQEIRENQWYTIPEQRRGDEIQSLGGKIGLREKKEMMKKWIYRYINIWFVW